MEEHAVARLVRSPPGYVGYEEGVQLTEAVGRHPYTVILLDEVEKAHPEVFNVLLQLLDDGRLTDSKGRTVDFKNTLIIMTSNLGSDIILEQSGASSEELYQALQPVLSQHFRPEFLNRLDETIIFEQLTQDEIKEIVQLQIKQLQERLKPQDITIEVSDEAVNHFASAGFDIVFGARPLKRLMQRTILNQLSTKILEGSIKSGDTAKVAYTDGKIVVK